MAKIKPEKGEVLRVATLVASLILARGAQGAETAAKPMTQDEIRVCALNGYEEVKTDGNKSSLVERIYSCGKPMTEENAQALVGEIRSSFEDKGWEIIYASDRRLFAPPDTPVQAVRVVIHRTAGMEKKEK